MSDQFDRLGALMGTQKIWWTLVWENGGLLVRQNTPFGSVVFGWPTQMEAQAWRDNLISNHGHSLRNATPSPIPFEQLQGLILEGLYDRLTLGESPDAPGLSLFSVR